MKFLQIELSNWALYKSPQVVQFDTTKEKPVVLINADNDKGKTSFFYAIKYCLFGEKGLKSHTKEEYKFLAEWPNFYSAADGDGELSVELKIQFDDGSIKRIQRKRKFFQTPRGEKITLEPKDQLTIFDDDEPLTIGRGENKEKESWIQKNTLPLDASQFFLFDGEVIQRYTEQPEEHVREAIHQLLGLAEIKNGTQDLGTLQNQIQEDKIKKARATTTDQKTLDKIDEIKKDIDQLKKDKKTKEDEMTSCENLIIENNKEISKYKELREKKDRQEELSTEIKSDTKTLEELNDELKTKRDFAGLLLLNPLLKIISLTEETPPSKEQWESKVAAYMIDNSHENCVCNCKIEDSIHTILKDKILDLKDNPFSRLKRTVEQTTASFRPDALEVELNGIVNKISDVSAKINNDEEERNRISNEIKGSKDIGEDLKRRESDNVEATKRIGFLQAQLPKVQLDLDRLHGKLNTLVSKVGASTASKELQEITQLGELTEKTIQVFDSAFRRYFEKRKPELEKVVSSVFTELTNAPEKYAGITLGDDFSIQILRKDGTKLPSHRYSPSAGASQIAATAVIAGFNKYTTRKSSVVIDTPAGRLDPTHTENLLEYYPKLSEQVIILPQSDEIDEKDEEIIADYIAVRYDIVPAADDAYSSVIVRRKN